MVKKVFVALCVLVVCVSAIHCEKLEETPAKGLLVFEKGTDDAIPLEYGDLVGVTPHPSNAGLAALWFEKADKNIAVVWVNVGDGSINDRVLVIPRR